MTSSLPKCVLIVEDNDLNTKLFRDLLVANGYRTLHTSNGLEVMDLARANKPDLILMDIRLPDESGLELTKKIKITSPHVKILILTGHHYPEYKEAAARYGADGFLVKGGSSKEILAMVESFFPKAEASTIAEQK